MYPPVAKGSERELAIGVREAAGMVGRSPETIRRWVWSGPLQAERDGRRILVSSSEVRALAEERGGGPHLRLPEWAAEARRALGQPGSPRRSAADLVLDDRRRHP